TPSSSTPLVKEEIAAVGHRNSKKQGRQSSSSRQNDGSVLYARTSSNLSRETRTRGKGSRPYGKALTSGAIAAVVTPLSRTPHVDAKLSIDGGKSILSPTTSVLVDSGSTLTAVSADFIRRHGFSKYVNSADGASSIKVVGGHDISVQGVLSCSISFDNGYHVSNVKLCVIPGLALSDVILGSDFLEAHAADVSYSRRSLVFPDIAISFNESDTDHDSPTNVHISGVSDGSVKRPDHPLHIESSDVILDFIDGRWVLKWKWLHGEPTTEESRRLCQPPFLYRRKMTATQQRQFEEEVQAWIDQKWLIPFDGTPKCIMALQAVLQGHKSTK
ncbi:hypothetical protein FOZ63_010461, partial [Perkinsus olseni]